VWQEFDHPLLMGRVNEPIGFMMLGFYPWKAGRMFLAPTVNEPMLPVGSNRIANTAMLLLVL
jgi:hypothetical protein